ncbi:MAG TPA: glycosyltransferase family 4 protein [Gemmatimonadales bacterium]|nr:glycosyltransferase family 4 protein [Gemmatimonadales bacterium]
MTRYAQDMLASDLTRHHRLTLLADNVPSSLRPKVTTEAWSWNFVGRDGVAASARVLAFVGRKFAELDRVCRRERVDIVHVLSTAGYGFFRNAAHIAIARRHGARTIFHLLGQFDDLYRDSGARVQALMRRSLDLADMHIVQSPGLAEVLRGMTRRPVRAIFNGVRTAELAPPDGWAHSNGPEVRVLALGIVGERKGTFDLLDAAERLRARRPDIRFLFVGGGEVERFRALARERGLANVAFAGAVDDAERVSLLHTSDVFALPSHAEGQPIAILEAMAAGLPILSSTVGSIPEVVAEANGTLVAPRDVGAIAAALESLADDRALRERIGRFNAREAAVKYDLPRVFREIDAVYAEL